MKTSDVHAVLFDMDGTLTDTEKYYNKNWVKAAHECGYDYFTREDALDLRSGFAEYSKNLMRERFGDDFDYDKVHELSGKLVDADLKKDGIPLKPGIDEILTFLHDNQIKAAVVTATGIERASARLKSLGLYDKFDAVISAHFVERGKPYPDPYLYACEQLGEKPADCLAVEDAPNGIKSAHDAGIPVIMVPDLTEPDEILSKLLYARVDSLDKIAQLFD